MDSTVLREPLRICDGCDATVYAARGALIARWHWRTYFGKGWELLLCPACRPEYDEEDE